LFRVLLRVLSPRLALFFKLDSSPGSVCVGGWGRERSINKQSVWISRYLNMHIYFTREVESCQVCYMCECELHVHVCVFARERDRARRERKRENEKEREKEREIARAQESEKERERERGGHVQMITFNHRQSNRDALTTLVFFLKPKRDSHLCACGLYILIHAYTHAQGTVICRDTIGFSQATDEALTCALKLDSPFKLDSQSAHQNTKSVDPCVKLSLSQASSIKLAGSFYQTQ